MTTLKSEVGSTASNSNKAEAVLVTTVKGEVVTVTAVKSEV